MSKHKHTPGPWGWVGNMLTSPKDDVAIVDQWAHTDWEKDQPIVAANRSLIAAAPDLLAALEIAVGQLEGIRSQSGVHASSLMADLRIAREAIAKAKGGS